MNNKVKLLNVRDTKWGFYEALENCSRETMADYFCSRETMADYFLP